MQATALSQLRISERDLIVSLRMGKLEPAERLRAEALCKRILEDETLLSDEFKGEILEGLKKKRFFQLMETMAEHLIREGTTGPEVYRPYAQALIENGKRFAAECVLRTAQSEIPKDHPEYWDMCGLMGRIHKQAFVTLAGTGGDPARRDAELNAAIGWYQQDLESTGKGAETRIAPYAAVNIVALATRAQRDNIATSLTKDQVTQMAQGLYDAFEANDDPDAWDCANAAEASLALGSPKVLKYMRQYVDRRDTDAFELASTLRQLTEIWQLPEDDAANGKLISLLKATLFACQGGPIELGTSNTQQVIDEATQDAQSTRSPEWFQQAIERSKSVGLITTPSNKGTGFLVKGSDICEGWGDKTLFLTNSHVTLADNVKDMSVRFEATDPNTDHRVLSMHRQSPPDGLDYAFLELESLPTNAVVAPVSNTPVTLEGSTERVYVIGHPNAGALTVSLYNNSLVSVSDRTLHYTSATEPGSSGSPVFDEKWNAVGLHHGVATGYFPDGTKYSTHEGISLVAVHRGIMDQAILQPWDRTHP